MSKRVILTLHSKHLAKREKKNEAFPVKKCIPCHIIIEVLYKEIGDDFNLFFSNVICSNFARIIDSG